MKRITIEVEDDTHAKLKRLAEEDGRALVRYIQRLLRSHAERKER